MSEPFPLDPEKLAELIDIPLRDWPGNCHAVARAVLACAPVPGMRIVRGHYHGHVSRASVYRGSVQQHSWLEAQDGRILDPTRWAMTSPGRPHIYLGDNDAYDEAGLMLRARAAPHLSMSLFLSGEDVSRADGAVLEVLKDQTPGRLAQIFGTAGMQVPDGRPDLRHAERLRARMADPAEHFQDPQSFFGAIKEIGLAALVPFDTMQRVLTPEQVYVDRGANLLYELTPPDEINNVQRLFKVICRFLSVEARGLCIEEELDELGYSLEMLHHALNEMESALRYDPEAPYFFRRSSSLLAIVAGELLGKGFGAELEVERFARSIGLTREALHCAMIDFGDLSGYTLPWLCGDEAKAAERAMAEEPTSEMAL